MRRVISMPGAIIAALVMLAGFDSAARSDAQASSSKYCHAGPLCCTYAIVRPFIAILTFCPL